MSKCHQIDHLSSISDNAELEIVNLLIHRNCILDCCSSTHGLIFPLSFDCPIHNFILFLINLDTYYFMFVSHIQKGTCNGPLRNAVSYKTNIIRSRQKRGGDGTYLDILPDGGESTAAPVYMWLDSWVSWVFSNPPWCSLGGTDSRCAKAPFLGEPGLEAVLSWGELVATPCTPSSWRYWAPLSSICS